MTAHRVARTLGCIGVAAAATVAVTRTGRRSGVGDAEIAMPLPGDEVVAQPTLVCDRVTTVEAPPEDVWPWIVQLGKDRAGWYLPRPVAALVPARRQGAWVIRPDLQQLSVGAVVPDWGPMPFTVRAVEPSRHLVYTGERSGHSGGEPSRPLALSWALVLRPAGPGTTRLHLRLRLRGTTRFPAAVQALGGFVDYLTVALLFAGLRQRVARASDKGQSADQ